MATHFLTTTHSTRDAAASRLAMALKWGDILPKQQPAIVQICKPGHRPRYGIRIVST